MKLPLLIRVGIVAFAILCVQGSAAFSAETTTTSVHPVLPDMVSRWTNSLGMEFLPVPQTNVLFCVWKTRVQDFQAFVNEAHYDATNRGWTLPYNDNPSVPLPLSIFGINGLIAVSRGNDLRQRIGNWNNPGFNQSATHPVCGISWVDAHAFCLWLTKKERQIGVIAKDHIYRLPTDA